MMPMYFIWTVGGENLDKPGTHITEKELKNIFKKYKENNPPVEPVWIHVIQ